MHSGKSVLEVKYDDVLKHLLVDPDFSCVVEGVPVPTRLILGRRLVRLSPKVYAWRTVVWHTARKAIPVGCRTHFPLPGPVIASMIFRLPRPKRFCREWLAVTPDIKNLMSPVEDALAGRIGKVKRSPGLVIEDDKQIVGYWLLFKRYTKEEESPGVEIKLWSLKSRRTHENKTGKRE